MNPVVRGMMIGGGLGVSFGVFITQKVFLVRERILFETLSTVVAQSISLAQEWDTQKVFAAQCLKTAGLPNTAIAECIGLTESSIRAVLK